jgi:hypothetical protein
MTTVIAKKEVLAKPNIRPVALKQSKNNLDVKQEE